MAEAYHAANNYLVVRLQLHGDSHDELPIFYEAADEIKRLRAERDEARRIACEKEERLGCDESGCPKNGLAVDHAKRRGWDCFDNLSETA